MSASGPSGPLVWSSGYAIVEHSLLADAISTKISCAGTIVVVFGLNELQHVLNEEQCRTCKAIDTTDTSAVIILYIEYFVEKIHWRFFFCFFFGGGGEEEESVH